MYHMHPSIRYRSATTTLEITYQNHFLLTLPYLTSFLLSSHLFSSPLLLLHQITPTSKYRYSTFIYPLRTYPAPLRVSFLVSTRTNHISTSQIHLKSRKSHDPNPHYITAASLTLSPPPLAPRPQHWSQKPKRNLNLNLNSSPYYPFLSIPTSISISISHLDPLFSSLGQ